MERKGVCVVSPSPDKILALNSQLGANPAWAVDVAFSTCDGDTLLANLHRFPSTCTVIDLGLGGDAVQTLVSSLQRAGYGEIILWGSGATDLGLQCEVVADSAPASSLAAAVHRLCSSQLSDYPAASSGAAARRRPTIITVHSPKGGSGKTLLACALAVQYTAKGRRTLLLDLAQYGGVSPALGLLRREKGLAKVLESRTGRPGFLHPVFSAEALLDNFVHFPVGDAQLDILPPALPIKMAGLGLEQAEALLQSATSLSYDVLIVDTSSEIAERTIVAMKASDAVLLVITPDLPAAWALLAMKDMLHHLNSGGKLQVVLNRSAPGTSPREIETALGYPVVAQIPEVPKPWEQAVGKSLAFDYTPFGLAVKHLAQRYVAVFRSAEIPALKK